MKRRKRCKAKLPRKLAAFIIAVVLVTVLAIHDPIHAASIGAVIAGLYASFVGAHQHAEHLQTQIQLQDNEEEESS
jgi:hypothetical protein